MFLNNDAMRVVERNDRGVVTYRKRYKRGDKVDVSHLPEGRADALLASGTLVRSKDDVQSPGAPRTAYTGSQITGAATGEPRDQSEIEGPGAGTPVEGLPDEDDNTEGVADEDDNSSENEHDVDEFDAMDYQQLQAAAKAADLNAGGSGEDLRARLREYKNSQ